MSLSHSKLILPTWYLPLYLQLQLSYMINKKTDANKTFLSTIFFGSPLENYFRSIRIQKRCRSCLLTHIRNKKQQPCTYIRNVKRREKRITYKRKTLIILHPCYCFVCLFIFLRIRRLRVLFHITKYENRVIGARIVNENVVYPKFLFACLVDPDDTLFCVFTHVSFNRLLDCCKIRIVGFEWDQTEWQHRYCGLLFFSLDFGVCEIIELQTSKETWNAV